MSGRVWLSLNGVHVRACASTWQVSTCHVAARVLARTLLRISTGQTATPPTPLPPVNPTVARAEMREEVSMMQCASGPYTSTFHYFLPNQIALYVLSGRSHLLKCIPHSRQAHLPYYDKLESTGVWVPNFESSCRGSQSSMPTLQPAS